jgi:hypothetical protein
MGNPSAGSVGGGIFILAHERQAQATENSRGQLPVTLNAMLPCKIDIDPLLGKPCGLGNRTTKSMGGKSWWYRP